MSRTSPSGTAARIGRSRGEVLVGLVRDQPRALAGRQVVHREEEQVGGAHQVHRLAVRQQAGRAHEGVAPRRPRGRAAVSSPARCSSTRPSSEGSAAMSAAIASTRNTCERVQRVHPGDRPAQQAPARARAPQAQAEVGVQRSRVDDPEHAGRRRAAAAAARSRRARSRSGSRGDAAASSGIARRRRTAASGAAMTTAEALDSAARILPQLERAGARRWGRPHLVERPRVLEVGHPRRAELGGQARARQRGLVGQRTRPARGRRRRRPRGRAAPTARSTSASRARAGGREPPAGRPGPCGGVGSGPSTRCTSVPSGHARSAARRRAGPSGRDGSPGPVTTTSS